MSTILTWVLAASATLAPHREHDLLAHAIAEVAESEPPLFRDDDDRRKTAAFLVAVAFRESSLRADAVGDHVGKAPTSFCAFQIHLPWGKKTGEGFTAEELTRDPVKCVTAAHHLLRASFRACKEHPLAWYAAGPSGCSSPRAQRISRDRVALAARLAKDVTIESAKDDGVQSATAPPKSASGTPSSPRDTRVAEGNAAHCPRQSCTP